MLAADVTVKAYAEQGYVQRVLAGWTGPEYEFNAVFPRGRVQSPKVRAFVDFLVERLNFDADYMQVLCPNVRARYEAAEKSAAEAINAELAKVAEQPAAKAKRKAKPAQSRSRRMRTRGMIRRWVEDGVGGEVRSSFDFGARRLRSGRTVMSDRHTFHRSS